MDFMKSINLTRNKITIVDDDLFEELNKFKWHYSDGYAVRSIWNPITKKQSKIWMHRLINNTPEGFKTDHVDGNKLNNLHSNLRTATISENNRNRNKQKNNSSGYKGVSWDKRTRKWLVQLSYNKKRVYIGYFNNLEEAINQYDIECKKYHKNFANYNKK